MQENRRPLAGCRFGILGKGGAGKSTITVVLAAALRRRGYEVCVLDADSTNVGLHRAFGLDEAPRALLDHYGGMVFSGGMVTCPVDDPTPLADAELDLEELPDEFVGRSDCGVVLLSAGKIGDKGPGAGCDGPISKIARDVRIRAGRRSPLTLVDFKAGFEDSARGSLNNLDWAIAAVDPTVAAIQMAAHLSGMIQQTRAGVPPATFHLETPDLAELARRQFREARIRDLSVVLNRVRNDGMRELLLQRLAELGLRPIAAFPEDPEIAIAWLEGLDLTGAYETEGDRLVVELERVARPIAGAA